MIPPWVHHRYNWESIGQGYDIFPPSLLRLGKANKPNPCPATPIIHRLHTHSPSHTAFIWAWNGFLLSARMHHLTLDVILFLPTLFLSLCLCATRVLLFSIDKCLTHCNKHIPGLAMIKISRDPIIGNITWICSKSETHDSPNHG